MSKVEQRPVIGIVPTQVPDEDIVRVYGSDGLVEAIEVRDHTFMMGVQWHPVFFTTTKFRISRLISFGFHRFAKVPHPFFANCPIFPSSRLPRTFCSARRTQPADHDA